MLIIVGLALFIMVSLVLYLSKSSLAGKAKKETGRMQEISTNSIALKDYIQQCLDKTTKDAIYMIGKQGGALYSSQNGPQADYQDSDEGVMYILHEGEKVSYNILPLRKNNGP